MPVNRSIGAILETDARGLAGFAAESLISRAEAGGDPTGASFRYWQAFFESRVKDLGAAVAAGQPRLFISQVRWCRAAMNARGVDTSEVRRALDVLADVIGSQIDDRDHDVVRDYIEAAVEDFDREVAPPPSMLDVTTPCGRLAAEFVLAVLEGRRRDATKLITDAVQNGLPVKDAYLKVIVPAVSETGRMWHLDEVTVAEEHFASDTASAAISQLQGLADVAPPNGKTMLTASVAGNRHDMGARILANIFETEGWRSICLGSDMPGSDIAQAVIDFDADLLLLSATLHLHLQAVQRTIGLVRNQSGNRPIRILVGGRAFDEASELAEQFGADGYARSVDDALDIARAWFPA